MPQRDDEYFSGERALFASRDITLTRCVFDDGESPLKESRGVRVADSVFRWKYPLWYCSDVEVRNTAFTEMARAGIWYTTDVRLKDCTVQAPKALRRCARVNVENTSFSQAEETLWQCKDVHLDHVMVRGDYFGMNCTGMEAAHLDLAGNYSFDGARDITITDSRLISKDAFWNCENVVVRDCLIVGEYLGWNSRNLTFINCDIESLQGLCYIDGLRMEGCRLFHTDRAFEYCSNIDADITTHIDSITNPTSGVIRAPSIGDIVFSDSTIDRNAIRIEVG